MKDGIAQKESLRFMRVVNEFDVTAQYDETQECPMCRELVFEAPVIFTGDCKRYQTEFEQAVRATRHIGMDRNRGMGNVKMRVDMSRGSSMQRNTIAHIDNISQEGPVKISYRIKTVSPIVASADDDSKSDSCIRGTGVRGMLATEYLRDETHSATDDTFRKLFLEDKVIYSDLTLADMSGEPMYKVPLFMRELKKTKKKVNLAIEHDMPEPGDQPKIVKRAYAGATVCDNSDKFDKKEPQTEISYHNRVSVSKGVYYLEALASGQEFAGEIIADAEYVKEIDKLFKSAEWRFGKSSAVQYGETEFISAAAESVTVHEIPTGHRVMVVFRSDAVFMDGDGNYTVNRDAVKNIIANQLDPGHTILDADSLTDAVNISSGSAPLFYDYIQTGVRSGYNTNWNRRKPDVPVVKAGSSFAYTLNSQLRYIDGYMGARQSEGFGKFVIIDLDDKQEKNTDANIPSSLSTKPDRAIIPLCRAIQLKRIQDLLEQKAVSLEDKLSIDASALGRVTLMLTESIENNDDPIEIYKDFKSRVESIKTDSTRNRVLKFIKGNLCGRDNPAEGLLETLKNLVDPDACSTFYDLYDDGQESADRVLLGLWPTYMQNILNCCKYNQKLGENAEVED